jgi:hypothetical protein
MTGHVRPTTVKADQKPFRRKVKRRGDEEIGFQIAARLRLGEPLERRAQLDQLVRHRRPP